MMFNATFNNISVISWRSVLLVEETGGPGQNTNVLTLDSLVDVMISVLECESSWVLFQIR